MDLLDEVGSIPEHVRLSGPCAARVDNLREWMSSVR